MIGRKQETVLSFDQHVMEAQESRGPQNNRGPQNACRAHQQGAQSGDDAIRGAKVRSSLPTTIQNQDLVSHQYGFGNNRTDPTRPRKSNYGDDKHEEKGRKCRAWRDGIKRQKDCNSGQLGNSPYTGRVRPSSPRRCEGLTKSVSTSGHKLQ